MCLLPWVCVAGPQLSSSVKPKDEQPFSGCEMLWMEHRPERWPSALEQESDMSSMRESAERFFDACETGGGWDSCKEFCNAEATFSAQAGALEGVETLEAYTEWMKGLLTPVPDGSYELRSFAVDEDRNNVSAFAVFSGTHTGEGGPVPPTGNSVAADYVYVMQFDGDRISHMTKIWNDGVTLTQLGWM